MNTLVYYITQTTKNRRIDTALHSHLNDLEKHYEILLYHQNIIAQTTYESTIEIAGFLDTFSKAQTSSEAQQIVLRKKIELLLIKKYKRLQKSGVLQYHFILPNNVSFLRMHKLAKFGDDLSGVRKDIKHVNETKTALRGFTQGRTSHGFRNVFPIFDEKGKYLGAMEVSFSSDEFLRYLTEISKIHTHFLVDKQIFTTNTWSRDDVIVRYHDSKEHKDYMVSIGKEHTKESCLESSNTLLKSEQNKIYEGIAKGNKFSFYVEKNDQIGVVSFLPVKNLDGTKNLAWFVSYVESKFIYSALKSALIIRTVLFILFTILGYLAYRVMMQQREKVDFIKTKAYIDGLTGVYNRNRFDKVVKRELSRNERYKRNLSMALIDIDHFKDFNDTHGHLIGDEVLIVLAQNLKDKVRATDTFARWGGEEFVILFPETSFEEVEIICENLRESIEDLKHKKAGAVTASFGFTTYMQGDTLDTMFQRCDEALYEAKENGRNRVCFK